jgi:hypothetical protein
MGEENCDCNNVLTYRNENPIVIPSCEYCGKKCTPKKNWVMTTMTTFQALIFVFICVYLTFYI